MARLLLIVILAGLALLPDGMAFNPQQCSACPTPTPKVFTGTENIPTVIPDTPEPTEEPWTCPVIGGLSKKEYREACIESCELTGQHGCAGICNQCWKGE